MKLIANKDNPKVVQLYEKAKASYYEQSMKYYNIPDRREYERSYKSTVHK